MEQAEAPPHPVPRPPPSSSLLLPSEFVQDPAAYLAFVASEPPSHEALKRLAGSVASWFQSPASAQAASQVANIYLQAAAAQLRFEASAVGAAAGGRLEEIEMLHTQRKYEVIETVGVAATQCIASRISITSSGIIHTLGQITLNHPNELQQASVEFLQCALLAEQYRYASRLVQGTWPRPTEASSVKQVLRYYYLRGMIHLGCNDYVMAHRCFWTCLSIPSDSVSKITLEAWKKTALVQCLMGKLPQSKTIQTPKAMPNCMVRLLSTYKEASKRPDPTGEGRLEEFVLQQQAPELAPPPQRLSEKTAMQAITCYMDLLDTFYKRDKVNFQFLMTSQETILREDGNFGLVQQCLTQLVRNQVLHLSNMYSVVPVSKVATLLGLSDESTVPTVLLESKVPCQIQDDGMVTFQDQDTTTSSSSVNTPPSMVDMAEWMQLIEKVQKLDVAIVTNPKYYALIQKDSASRKEAAAAGPRGVEDF